MNHNAPTRDERVAALLTSPLLHRIAADVPEHDVGRPRQHPIGMHIARGALARLWRSSAQVDADFRHGTWASVQRDYRRGARAAGTDPGPAFLSPLYAGTYRHTRDHLARPDVLPILLDSFTRHSLGLAHDIGLLREGTGSRTRPDRTRVLYGDGTVVRPLYRPAHPGARGDNDAIRFQGHDGPVTGTNLVHISTRGPEPYRRVIVGIGIVTQRGAEADTAVEVLRSIHRYCPDGPQAVVYDGAFRGTHHQQVMSDLGWIPINKVHPATHRRGVRTWRTLPLGTYQHAAGRRVCTHTLVAHNGSVHDATTNDRGDTVLSAPLDRHQVRRYPRADGRHRFTIGVTVPCAHGTFLAWIAPHPRPDDDNHRRPDQLRLIPISDPLFAPLYGLRNDAEAINSEYKATLLWKRAQQLGAARQALDLLCWAIANNSLAWHRHQPTERSRAA